MTHLRFRRSLIGGAVAIAAASATTIGLASKRIVAEQAAFRVPAVGQCVPSKLNRSAVLPGTSVAVSPLPDSLDASPRTQISLLGGAGARFDHVSVSGSRSGSHSGRLRAYSQGDGASFVPNKAFQSNEAITVRGTFSAPGKSSQRFAYHFATALQDPLPHAARAAEAAGKPGDIQHFHSRADLQPPTISVTANSPQATPGYVFATPYSGPGQDGPMIFDNAGKLVWFNPLPRGTEATDLQVQQLDGKPVLSWWQGYIPPQGFGEGEVVIANSSYQRIAHVKAGNGYLADLHDFHITAQNTGLLTVFDPIRCNLSAVGGPRGAAITDGVLQELDLHTGLVRREWHALDHVKLSESHSLATHSTTTWPFDFFHINSVDVQADGGLLLSARNTWALYKLDRRSLQVTARIGGKRSNFKLGSGAATAYQHDAHQRADGTISVFDNGAVPKVHSQSRGLILSLDPKAGADTVVKQFTHSPALVSGSQANLQTLPDGGAFIGWGSEPYFTEYNANGDVLFDAHMPTKNQSYRGYRFPWVGTPGNAPAIAFGAASSSSPATVYASWNGATKVASWRVLGGPSASELSAIANAPRGGFETAIPVPGSAPYLAVQALDAAGNVLSTSPAIKG
ncbi:MAG TPA: arylsulfotransferase family protein [Solirubrobacteraceae bacterium]|nr:arylsulfotransferase family protein [Solirubrobacteraceae bacterium]